MPKNKIPFITDLKNVKGKRVLVRGPLNVPLDNGVVRNHFRIVRALPTLSLLVQEGAKVILIGHIGRGGDMSLEPVYNVLKQQLNVVWCQAVIGEKVKKAIDKLENGQVLLLENLRCHEGEITNDEEFSKELASYGDVFINDAFSDAHRSHASMVGIPQYLPSYFGLTFHEEYVQLSKAMNPIAPSVFILGGAKFVTKEPLIERYLHKYDKVFVGGALANDFFKVLGYEVGESKVSEEGLKNKKLVKHPHILLPVDVTVKAGSSIRVTTPDAVQKDESILDAGPATVALLRDAVKGAHTILWNGPLGDYEHGFVEHTHGCAEVIAGSGAYSVIGGGDTVAAIESLCINDRFNFISTAGGAMLHFLEHGTLPAIDAVIHKK